MDEQKEEIYLADLDKVQCSLENYDEAKNKFDLDANLYQVESQLDLLSSHADNLDYFVAIASGIACSMLDIFWCGDIDLAKAHEIGSDKVERIVEGTAKHLGCEKSDDLTAAVRFLENYAPIPSDKNMNDFGGPKYHHLYDLEHHPTVVGLIFSILTQFTEYSYGTDKTGCLNAVKINAGSKAIIGKTVPEKLFMGTITWFFHLVSDIAGSSSTAAKSGGTGIPGPILGLAKELSALPVFQNLKVDDDSISKMLSRLFNGTLLADHDQEGKVIKGTKIKFDLRTEMGLSEELSRQSIPVVANECIVKVFYFIRRLGVQIREQEVHSLDDLKNIDWDNVRPANNPTIDRMLTIATAVFSTVDIGEAVISQQYLLAINYAGIGRFAVAVGRDVSWELKRRDLKKIQKMYQDLIRNTYREIDNNIYGRIESDMSDVTEGFGLNKDQIEILYNIEYQKTLHDVEITGGHQNRDSIQNLKREWLDDWQKFMTEGFPSFIGEEDATLKWYSKTELMQRISELEPTKTWYRLVLLEAMLFEPYFPLETETDEKGKTVQSKKYNKLQVVGNGFKKKEGDSYLEAVFAGEYCSHNYIRRLRTCYDKCTRELNEVLKTALKTITIAAVIATVTIAAAGMMAPIIATALVGSNFAGLSGAALTSACLAYLGGGAIAAGGAGMLGGTVAIVGGGAVLGIGGGFGVGSAVGAVDIAEKKNTIAQSAKLLVSVREIFLNDEHDVEFSNAIYEQYLDNIVKIEQSLVELKLKADVSTGKEKKELTEQIKEAEKTVEAMKIARKSMLKFQSAFQEGLNHQEA